jgi:hypothetical protein
MCHYLDVAVVRSLAVEVGPTLCLLLFLPQCMSPPGQLRPTLSPLAIAAAQTFAVAASCRRWSLHCQAGGRRGIVHDSVATARGKFGDLGLGFAATFGDFLISFRLKPISLDFRLM